MTKRTSTHPATLPVLPLRDVVAFPHVTMPLVVGRPGSVAAVNQAWDSDQKIVLCLQRSPDVATPRATDLYRVGVLATIRTAARLPNGTIRVMVEGESVVRLTRVVTRSGVLRSVYRTGGPVDDVSSDQAAGLARTILTRFEEYVGLQRRLPSDLPQLLGGTTELQRLAWLIAAHLHVKAEQRQRLLETTGLSRLLQDLHATLVSEIELLRLERKIDDDVRGSIYQNQREFYLQEQLRAIHRELGQDDGEDLDEIEAQLDKRELPEPVRARAMREIRKLRRMPSISPEATVSRHYLDWILGIPWTERSDDVADVMRARAILDEDHYGLLDVKDRILDYLAVLASVGSLGGQMLCLVGPPGVGKTSLGRSIARALGRQFVRMSLGGVHDEAEIRGHRRTYIGALPGRIIQAMRRAGVVNPVILLDEIDKLGKDYRGDPGSALLEVLDPEQNRAFNDHFLELDYDLSQVFFITTANSVTTIPEPLRDRMETLRLPGYLDQEKLAIARQYLLPRQCAKHGVGSESVKLDPAVLPTIMREYTREAGVREFERQIARLVRKVARRRLENPDRASGAVEMDSIAVADLKGLLGVAPYDADEVRNEEQVGVATGLAYTAVGGEVLDIEVAVLPGRGRVHLTGALGDVMKESASAALSYTRSRAEALGIPPDFHRGHDIHIHVPAGATPKDGPSAGIAMAVALISALTGVPARGALAMTGEITLRGRVLPIGGLKEKTVAALRLGKSVVLLPAANGREIEELPEEVRTRLTLVPVATMDEVLAHALTRLPRTGPGQQVQPAQH
ncbi:MAG: endopeptidase La [Gemmatimonadota bacterium]